MADTPPISDSQQKRKRASRKNTPKRFSCDHEGCTKIYSRLEHLQRHQLNPAPNLFVKTCLTSSRGMRTWRARVLQNIDKPKKVFRCQAEGCGQTFVRLDLCMRHQARHGETSKSTDRDAGIMVRESTYEFSAEPADEDSLGPRIVETNVTISQPTAQDTTEDQSIPLEIGTNLSDWMPTGMLQNNAEFVTTCQHSNENFATWLFDSPGSQQQNFDLSNFLPYMDFGIDYCSPINDLWHLDSSNNAANPPVSDLSPTMVVTEPTFQSADQYGCNSHTRVSVQCRSRVVQSISLFLMKKRPPGMQDVLQEEDLLFGSNGRDLPNLTVKVLEDCLSSFWTYVAVQMPIIHQQTFSSDDCQLLLLLSILMLGAGQIVRLHPMKTRDSHRLLADLLAINLRWEIFPEAEPPITLWVAQSLLLLEFYEKMFSSRRLHERAYIHHASTLALLRRGSPMVGHAEDEEPPTRCPSPGLNMQQSTGVSKQLSWWRRWARNESWHRVVFAALQMDTLHAIAFGHESSLLPYEVRLPLPCDDALWSAQSPEDVWRLEETFLMHGISQQPFLDNLKRCLHGHEVRSNHGARIILGSGLLSVGWHIKRRERNQQFLDTIPSAQEQERWRTLLLNAYSHWCQSFQKALEKSKVHSRKHENIRDVVFNPIVLFRLAFITTHIDILDAQVFAGYKRLLGRKITDKDYLGCSTRMRSWAMSNSSRLAVTHAFEFLDETLLRTNSSNGVQVSDQVVPTGYTCRADASSYRPWGLYLAALTIWSYQFASRASHTSSQTPYVSDQTLSQSMAYEYIRRCTRSGVHAFSGQMSAPGCAAVCKYLAKDFANAEWELLLEASRTLDSCASTILDR